MPLPVIAAAAAPIVGGLVGKAIGPKQATTTPQLPGDLAGPRQQQIQLMQYLLGFGPNPQSGAQPQASPWGPSQGNFNPGAGVAMGGQSGGGMPNGPSLGNWNPGGGAAAGGGQPGGVDLSGMGIFGPRTSGGQGQPGGFGGGPTVNPSPFGPQQQAGQQGFTGNLYGEPGQRVQSIFGDLSQPQSPLQRGASTGIGQFLNQQSPESQTLGMLGPGLQQLFQSGVGGATGSPGGLPGGPSGNNLLPPEVMQALTGIATGHGGFGGMGFGGGAGGGLGMEGTQALQRILGQAPGQGVIDALQPSFQRNLALANQEGGRFGSANALTRTNALNDFNLLAAQAAQQGTNQQLDAAQRLASLGIQQGASQAGLNAGAQAQQLQAIQQLMQGALGGGQLGLQAQGQAQQGALGAGGLLGSLSGQAGQNDFQRLLQGFGVGQQQSNQADVGTQRNLAILLQQLGGMQQATLGAPIQTTPSGAQQGVALGGGIGSLLAGILPTLLANGGAGSGGGSFGGGSGGKAGYP